MKKTIFVLTGLMGLGSLSAQIKEGTVVYEQKVNMHKTIQDEQMKAMIPEFRTNNFQLLFSDSVSVYKMVSEDEAPDPFGGGSRIIIRMGGGGGDIYKNLSQSKSIQSSEVGGKNFLIIDSIRQQPWKLSNETQQILGYTCHKATSKIMQASPTMRRVIMNGGGPSTDTTRKASAAREVDVVAWYADDLLSPTGPENYGQLPGVILQLNVDNGTTVYTATEVSKKVDARELKEPKKGKVMNRKEFMKMMNDMMSNQGGNFRFGG